MSNTSPNSCVETARSIGPDNPQEERFLHGAACHGCLLIAETSCERYNEYLDRELVVPTVMSTGVEFFEDMGS